MSAALLKSYTSGTHRLVSPEVTYQRIQPRLARFGITRCADVTGLDRIGIPVYCAIRPAATTLQVSNGKGLRAVDAKVSALMEAIELYHAETPSVELQVGSETGLRKAGLQVLPPPRTATFRPECHYTADTVLEWVEGEDVTSGETVWLPASIVYPRALRLSHWTGNGLASGNHVVEATLHGLYEVLERHVLSDLSERGLVHFERANFIDTTRFSDATLSALHERIHDCGLRLLLARAPSALPIHALMAIILDPDPLGAASRVNIGYGAHSSAIVAAARAITEAAQSRLTFIHGAREDLQRSAFHTGAAQGVLFDFFSRIAPAAVLEQFSDSIVRSDLTRELEALLSAIASAGLGPVYRVNLSRSGEPIAVVHVGVIGAHRPSPIFA